MARYEPIRVEIAGRAYNATWHMEGAEVCVSSAYGSRKAALKRSKPETVAARLLREIVSARPVA